jgi:hypothetical protein
MDFSSRLGLSVKPIRARRFDLKSNKILVYPLKAIKLFIQRFRTRSRISNLAWLLSYRAQMSCCLMNVPFMKVELKARQNASMRKSFERSSK